MPAKKQNPTCTYCDEKPIAKNMCWKHYQRVRRTGTPHGPSKITLEDVLSNYVIDVETGCWRWQGGKLPTGYGRGSLDGQTFYTHRFFYEHHVGPIPPGMTIDHDCRNVEWVVQLGRPEGYRDCCNPEHLTPRPSGENTRRSMHLHRIRESSTDHPPPGP